MCPQNKEFYLKWNKRKRIWFSQSGIISYLAMTTKKNIVSFQCHLCCTKRKKKNNSHTKYFKWQCKLWALFLSVFHELRLPKSSQSHSYLLCELFVITTFYQQINRFRLWIPPAIESWEESENLVRTLADFAWIVRSTIELNSTWVVEFHLVFLFMCRKPFLWHRDRERKRDKGKEGKKE